MKKKHEKKSVFEGTKGEAVFACGFARTNGTPLRHVGGGGVLQPV